MPVTLSLLLQVEQAAFGVSFLMAKLVSSIIKSKQVVLPLLGSLLWELTPTAAPQLRARHT